MYLRVSRPRLAVEVAANAEAERRATGGELSSLGAGWGGGGEITAIADPPPTPDTVTDRLRAPGGS